MTAAHIVSDEAELEAEPSAGLAWRTVRQLGVGQAMTQGEALSWDDGFLIESGMVALFSHGDGRATCVGVGRAGDLIGLTQAISAQPSAVRPVVIGDGTALRFSRSALRREWETSAFFREAALLEAHRSVEAARRWSDCLMRHSATERLATLLLWLASTGAEGKTPLRQQGAASVLNVRRTTVTSSAGELASAGAIEWRRGGAVVIDSRKLGQLACACADALAPRWPDHVSWEVSPDSVKRRPVVDLYAGD